MSPLEPAPPSLATTPHATTTLDTKSDNQALPQDGKFDNIVNFRDPDDASARDKERLVNDIHLASVVDLRSKTEHIKASERRRDANRQIADSPTATTTTRPATSGYEHLIELPGVRRVMVSLVGTNLQLLLLWRLSWMNLILTLLSLLLGQRMFATRLIATHVMNARGLIGLAHDTLTSSKTEISTLFNTVFSESATYPTLIHCTQGKDRTGLVVILLLLLAGAEDESLSLEEEEEDDEGGAGSKPTTTINATMKKATTKNPWIPLTAISRDYHLSSTDLSQEFAERMREIEEVGLTEEFAGCPDGFVEEVERFIESGYGGVRPYLRSIGVSGEVQERVRGLLIA
ncbi:hypothetical protein AJ80_05773 [Polytolypa hystricis UAMH7299]|uniref:Tyrosine specific protein phosphatases domain-containing protein n=1 Tax=Polytolypa hystricis (strain UAMH7299) TaxID=1447883 RepID=A0A2B7Y2A9_POLH7|nr:hypothetical protein AJ80_05773 [Polytolypa hystricis UAMH7299]